MTAQLRSLLYCPTAQRIIIPRQYNDQTTPHGTCYVIICQHCLRHCQLHVLFTTQCPADTFVRIQEYTYRHRLFISDSRGTSWPPILSSPPSTHPSQGLSSSILSILRNIDLQFSTMNSFFQILKELMNITYCPLYKWLIVTQDDTRPCPYCKHVIIF